ncbi:MAG: RNA polymerase sigma-54 factor [Planctomycetes bacterium]|jgi:RNA polymerase sigma-54 factor|nr:RNA polymerase sigma-54 factor [Planctomycetota bacterium]
MEQRLVQSPQMIQAMQILQLSALDLVDRISQELLENPFLEVDESTPEEESSPPEKEADGETVALEGMIDELERYDRDFGDGSQRRISGEDVDRKLEAMANTPATYHSLGDALMGQIALSDLDEHRREIAEYLVYSLDSRGYLTDPLEAIASQSGIANVTVEELEETLSDLRHATHPALGARDLQECLLLQLEPSGVDTPLVRALVENHLADITTNRLPHIARATGHTIVEVKHAIDSIRHLDPSPGREYGESSAETIHPDILVLEIDGTFEVQLTRQGVPALTISSTYRQLLRKGGKAEGVRKWVKERLESARWLIEAIEQRQSTLLRIANVVFERQDGFLQRGVKALVPLRMLEVADETGVHISTVSRAVAGKYAQTPHGILPLRFFFSGGTAKDSGGMASQASIKQLIKELIEKEDSSAPHSDDRLADLLKASSGIGIARRTITKYRKALKIPGSSQRRVF